MPTRTPTRFIACVTRPESAQRVKRELSQLTSSTITLTVFENENVRASQEADVVILGCKPYHLTTVLGAQGIKEALKGKLLISILAGVSVSQMEGALYGAGSASHGEVDDRCKLVRVMPNTAALIRESMSVIAKPDPSLPPDLQKLVSWIFTRVGRVRTVPANQMDVCTALCGSGPAMFAMVLEAIADGAVAMGLPRADAQLMAAQTMRGASSLVLNGEHPAMVREKVSTPGGCTIGGLLVLEERGLRGTVARGLREATVVASQLGEGKQGVNGTRF